MPTAPNTWQMLQGVQTLIQNEVLVNSTSPFTAFSTDPNPANPNPAMSDATRFGTNPNGAITNAIFIGVPKDLSNKYPRQCHIIPAETEDVQRKTFGGGNANIGGQVWDYMDILILVNFYRQTDWFGTQQDIVATRDAMWQVLVKHAELPNAPGVAASIPQVVAGARAFSPGVRLDLEWDIWAFRWRLKQVWSVSGGIVS